MVCSKMGRALTPPVEQVLFGGYYYLHYIQGGD